MSYEILDDREKNALGSVISVFRLRVGLLLRMALIEANGHLHGVLEQDRVNIINAMQEAFALQMKQALEDKRNIAYCVDQLTRRGEPDFPSVSGYTHGDKYFDRVKGFPNGTQG